MFKVNIRIIALKFSRLTCQKCGPYPVFACYTVISHATEEQSTVKTSVRLVEKCQLATIQCVDMAAFYG